MNFLLPKAYGGAADEAERRRGAFHEHYDETPGLRFPIFTDS